MNKIGETGAEVSTWAPLRNRIFRALWLAALVSNVGSWMQTVGAQWLLVNQPHASTLVALVQTADMLPVLLVALPAGVLADTLDRRWLLIAIQGALVVTGTALTLLTIAGQMPPALLLTFTFLLGAASAASTPAYQAIIPELVPRAQLPAASALGSININLARALGPAIAGILIARAGVGAVFALNTLTFLLFGLVVVFWRPAAGVPPSIPERFTSALRAGGRYVAYAPVVRRILLRAALFLAPGSALWALLPLIASKRLGLDAGGYGLLLGALGLGAVAGAFLLPRIRAYLSINMLVFVASVEYAASLLVLALTRNPIVAVIALAPTGVAWIAMLSSVNATLQLFLPAWVRARGLSVYQIVLFGAQAVGAVIWGVLAGPFGLATTFLIAAAIMLAGGLTVRRWPLFETAGVNRGREVYWPEPQLAVAPERESGPVVVTTTYTVQPENEQAFFQAMTWVRRSRLRTGASQWGLFRDGAAARRYVEFFVVPSWDEHLRQHHDRLTGADRENEERADALSDPPPQTAHFLSVDPGPDAHTL